MPRVANASASSAIAPITDPYEIFGRARAAWERQRYPAVLGYTIHVSANRDGSQQERHYHARWLARTNGIAVDLVSDEQRAHPYHVPPGVSIYGFNVGGPQVGDGVADDLLGVPIVSPNYSFGIADYVPPEELSPAQLVEEIRAEFHDANPAKVAVLKAKEGLKIIASVTTARQDYTIVLAGIETIGTRSAYHLHLEPRHDPKRLRLRDVWVDAQTFGTAKLVASGNFEQGAPTNVPWTVTFVTIGGEQYIESETAMASMPAGWFKRYDSYRLVLEDIGAASASFSRSFGNAAKLTEPAFR